MQVAAADGFVVLVVKEEENSTYVFAPNTPVDMSDWDIMRRFKYCRDAKHIPEFADEILWVVIRAKFKKVK